jgi:hypothetical protein
VADSVEQLSFELTSSVLGEQERAVSSLRVSAGTILGAASIVVSLLGTHAGGPSLGAWPILATLSYAFCFATSLWLLLPHGLVLSFGGTRLMVDGDSEQVADVAEGYRAVSRWIEPHVRRNHRVIDRLADWLAVSRLLLAVEVIAYTISLTS